MATQTQIPDFAGDSFPRARTDALHIDGNRAVEAYNRIAIVENSIRNLQSIEYTEMYDWIKNATADSYFERGMYQTDPALQFDPFLKMLCDKAAQGLAVPEYVALENGKIRLTPYTFDVLGDSKITAMHMEVLAYMLCQPYPVRTVFCPGLFFTDKANEKRNYEIFIRSINRLIELLNDTLNQSYTELVQRKRADIEM